MSVVSDFSEMYGSIRLKICPKNVKYIFNIIQNGSMVAVLGVNTLGAITRTTSYRFSSNLVQRHCIGGATCMPIHFLFIGERPIL